MKPLNMSDEERARLINQLAAGKAVSGIVRDNGISWTIGRSRGLGIS